MVGLAEITGTLSGIKTAFDIAKGLGGLKRESDVQAAISAIQSTLMDAQSKAIKAHEGHLALLQKVSDLEAEIAGLKSWEVEKQGYELTKVGTMACLLTA